VAANAFGEGGAAFDSADDLDAALKPMLRQDVTVLVKGSRAMQMERVVEALCAGAAPSGRSD
jgi:UDP-N-acetylmuramoyl-tripeptide--D-alanyl-D-alanine ligase